MVLEPQIANEELVHAVRAWHADALLAVRVRRRRRLRPTAGLTGSYFERVQLEIDGRRLNVLLKQGGLPFGPQARGSVFFAHLSSHVQVRAPRCFGVGQAAPGQDAWVLMERLPRTTSDVIPLEPNTPQRPFCVRPRASIKWCSTCTGVALRIG